MISNDANVQFSEWKGNIVKIIDDIIKATKEFSNRVKSVHENPTLLTIGELLPIDDVTEMSDNLQLNLKVISRNKMKCAFFGKTSNGKSAVINAILNNEILPSGNGRTTSCFIAVDGCDEDVGYLIDKNGDRCDVDDIMNIANELDDESYVVNSLVNVFWPKKKCPLLRNEIQFLDSPGVDFSTEHEESIKSHCTDADVFVFVVDACSTINESEKSFFKNVKSTVVDPNIFILMNKWDICENKVSETKLNRLKRQHLATVKHFFQNDLKINCNPEERTFFVSAKEMLEECTTLHPSQRRDEFNRFVSIMQTEMSQKAISTKFKPHLIKADECLQMVVKNLDTILNTREKNSPTEFDEVGISATIRSQLKIRFLEVERKLEQIITKESNDFVSFIIKNSHDLSLLEEIINGLAQRINRKLNQMLMNATSSALNEIRVQLNSLSQLKYEFNIIDCYFPSTSNDEPTPTDSSEPIISGASAQSENSKPAFVMKDDVISNIAIMLPLNIELGLILSKEKLDRLNVKKLNSSLKESSKQKLIDKIRNVLNTVFLKSLDEHRIKIDRTMQILVDKYLKDQKECCQFMSFVEQLRYFNSIQSLQFQHSSNNVDELIAVVQRSWEEKSVEKIENTFLSLQKALESSMFVGGGNNYKLVQMAKEVLRKTGQLPLALEFSLQAIETARNSLGPD